MIFTFTQNLSFSQASQMMLAKVEHTQSRFYRRLMKRIKVISKKPFVKGVFKLNAALERTLKGVMLAAHVIEKTWVYRFAFFISSFCINAVKQDGLILTILLTTLGYAAGCYFIL